MRTILYKSQNKLTEKHNIPRDPFIDATAVFGPFGGLPLPLFGLVDLKSDFCGGTKTVYANNRWFHVHCSRQHSYCLPLSFFSTF